MVKRLLLVVVLVSVLASFAVWNVPETSASSGTWQINAGSDDCLKVFDEGTWSFALGSGASAGYEYIQYYKLGSGLRFNNVNIPNGATISSAYLQLTSVNSRSATTVKSKIRGQASDNAVTFSTMADFDGRARTTALVYWDGIQAWSQDLTYNSPDVSSVIQEIVNRAGWVSGNSLVIFWDDFDDRSSHVIDCERNAISYEYEPSKAPKLVVIWDQDVPTYSNVGTNTTKAGLNCLFHTKWTDDMGLSGFVFGTNNTGHWVNETWVAFTANPDWSNITKTLNSTLGVRVEWRIWANDTSNNWGNIGLQYLITTATDTVTLTVIYPQNITYTESGIPVELTASGGVIDQIWYNCKNGTTWIYASNITYTSQAQMTGFSNGTYNFYAWANNTEGNSDVETVNFSVMIVVNYQYTFIGLFDEYTGLLKDPSERAVTVRAYFVGGITSETFTVNGTYSVNFSYVPLYFHYELGTCDREYWLAPQQYSDTFYIFTATNLTSYTVSFLDLSGFLDSSIMVGAKRYINGTLMTVEKRKIDVENKVVFSLVQSCRYTIVILDGISYTFGDVTFASVTSISLTLRGIDFPKETLLTCKYVRIYGDRVFNTPNGSISIIYQDTLEQTVSVNVLINYKNGTNVAGYYFEGYSTFTYNWTQAQNDTDYAVVCTINHQRYGAYQWKQYFPRSFSEAPWGLDWMGKLPFDTSILLPAFLILCAFGCFSVLNAYIGAFAGTVTAILLSYMGWINIPSATLIVALVFTILVGIIYAKRRVET